MYEPVMQLQILCGWLVPRIDQVHGQSQLIAFFEIFTGCIAPLRLHVPGSARVTVPWQIDEPERVVDQKEIQRLRTPGCRGCSRQAPDAEQGIQKTRFPNVRTSEEGDFRPLVPWPIRLLECALNEFRAGDSHSKKSAPGLRVARPLRLLPAPDGRPQIWPSARAFAAVWSRYPESV